MKFRGAATGLLTGLVLAANTWAAPAATDAMLQQGETLYRSGTSSRNNPVIAVVAGGTRLPGSAASCAGCHGRDGSGRIERPSRLAVAEPWGNSIWDSLTVY